MRGGGGSKSKIQCDLNYRSNLSFKKIIILKLCGKAILAELAFSVDLLISICKCPAHCSLQLK